MINFIGVTVNIISVPLQSLRMLSRGTKSVTVHRFRVEEKEGIEAPKPLKKWPYSHIIAKHYISNPPACLSYAELVYLKRSAMAGRFVRVWNLSVLQYKTFTKRRMVVTIQPLSLLTRERLPKSLLQETENFSEKGATRPNLQYLRRSFIPSFFEGSRSDNHGNLRHSWHPSFLGLHFFAACSVISD